MIKWLGKNQVVVLPYLLLIGYIYYGYLTWIDGQYFRRIATIQEQSSPYSDECKVTHITIKTQYKRGEMVEATVNIDKYRNIEGIVQWNLMDARYYPYAPRRGVVPLGHHKIQVPIEKIPMHIPLGEYYFAGSVKYEPNPISDFYITLRTNKFQVVE